MNWYKKASRIVLAKDGPHKFSSTQVQLPKDISAKVLALSQGIPDDELADDGKETDIHITVKYGIHTEDAENIRKLIEGFGEITATLGKTTTFPPNEKHNYDVLKIDVTSEDLNELNHLISDNLECTDTFPDYHPHVTVAYLQPGKGEKYKGSQLRGSKVTFNSVTFSSKAGKKTTIKL
jgi:2'-5' RNA ligase